MDRTIVYPGAIPLDTDLLLTQLRAMVSDGYLAQSVFGWGNVIADGLVLSPTVPASMTVTIGPGSIIFPAQTEYNPFGSLPADSTPLTKLCINNNPTNFTLTAPSTSGQSINYLIQAAFLESDTNPVVLPYYNASNPAVPYSGPGGSGQAQNTQRIQRVALQLKAGAPANTGTQTTPAIDSSWIGLYVITVNYGQTQITSANLASAKLAGAPFMAMKMPQLANGFFAYLASPGYQKLPSGLIMQWGGGNITSTSIAITWPIAFPNNPLGAVITDSAASAWGTTNVTMYGQSAGTRTGVTVNAVNWNGSTMTTTMNAFFGYLAWGY